MIRRRPLSTPIARWWWLSPLMALLVVGSISGLALAQQTSEGTMQVVILPPGDDLLSPTPETAGSETSRPAGYASGTVTVRLAVGAESSLRDGSLPAEPFLLTIFDERGTAYGWQVTLYTPAPQSPSVLANRTDTIVRILPIPTNMVDVFGARVLGPLDSPLPLLYAAIGTGAGIYTQRLPVAFDSSPGRATVPFLIGLPSAP